MKLIVKILFSFLLLIQLVLTVFAFLIYGTSEWLLYIFNFYIAGVIFLFSWIFLVLLTVYYYPKIIVPVILVSISLSLAISLPMIIDGNISLRTKGIAKIIIIILAGLQIFYWIRLLIEKNEITLDKE